MRALVACVLFACVLALASAGVIVDGRSNKWWIQIVISPGGAKKVDLKANGKTYHLDRCSWDKAKRAYTGKTNDAGIAPGSKVTVTAYYASGPKTTTVAWNYKGKPKYNGGGTTPSPGNKPPKGGKGPSGPVKVGRPPSGVNMGKVNSQISSFRGGSGTPAYVGGSENSLLKKWKNVLNNAISANGVSSSKTRSMIHALFALETETIYDSNGNAQRDASKDDKPLYKNFSPLNMNRDMLNFIKFKGNAESMNRASGIKLTVATLLRAITKMGFKPMLNFHRGGRTGFDKPSTPWLKIPQFYAGVYHMYQKFEADHSLWTDGRKVWANVDHV